MPAEPALGVNPADAAQVLKTLLEVWDLAADNMLRAVARRLARGITEQGWAERKAREVLAVRDELLLITAGLDRKTPDLVTKALVDAYEIGRRAAASIGQQVSTQPAVVQTLARRYVEQ